MKSLWPPEDSLPRQRSTLREAAKSPIPSSAAEACGPSRRGRHLGSRGPLLGYLFSRAVLRLAAWSFQVLSAKPSLTPSHANGVEPVVKAFCVR